ncbi:MAG: phosphotransferase [Patescibacteria group bacterium]
MTEQFNTTTPSVNEFITEKYAGTDIAIHSVEGGYSRNRRAIIDIGGTSVFAKEVDIDVLPDEGEVELGWLKKDYEIVNELAQHNVGIVPEWAELHLNGHLLLMPSYKKEDGWKWTLPDDDMTRTKYIQAVIDATKQLEETRLPEDLTEKLSLQPFFRDEIAEYEGIAPLFSDEELRARLIERYTIFQEKGGHLLPMNIQMVETLNDDESLRHLQEQTARLTELPNDCLNHCDVRSDNIAFNEQTGEVKFVDWNWASYAPARFGATEFLLDMARRGVDVSPWYKDMSTEFLAATVGFYMIRSLRPPLSPGSTLREMQAETAAVANYLYEQLR